MFRRLYVTDLLKYKKSGRMLAFLATTLLSMILNSNAFSRAATELPKEPPTATTKRILVLGRVSDNPKKHYPHLKPIADYMVAHMKDLGIVEAKTLTAKAAHHTLTHLPHAKAACAPETP